MQQEDLNRFLQNVHRTRLVDYLDPSPGESHEQALERKLRWAARSQSSAEHAFEAAFLLQHGDALRSHLSTAKAEVVEDEWIEFGGDDPDGGTVRMYQSSSANESIDLDALLSGAGGPGPTDANHPKAGTRPATAASPAATTEPDISPEDPERQVTAPAGTARSVRPAVTSRPRTPTPSAPNRRGSPRRVGGSSTPAGAPAGYRSPSPLLERARRNSPVPHLGRIGGSRPRNPGTPSPPLLSRSSTPSPSTRTATPRPEPERWSSGQSVKRVATPPGAQLRTPAPTYTPPGAPSASHSSMRGPTPPGTPRAATPGGYDVKITGHAQFVRNNDQYGTAEVVYESELNHGGQLRTPMPARTPLSADKRGGAGEETDILGSLRGNMRKGTPAQLAAIATRPQNIPPAVYLGLILVLFIILSVWTVGMYQGWLNNPFVPPVQDAVVNPGVQTGLIAPIGADPAGTETTDPTPADAVDPAADPTGAAPEGSTDGTTPGTDGTKPATGGTPAATGSQTSGTKEPGTKPAGTGTGSTKPPKKDPVKADGAGTTGSTQSGSGAKDPATDSADKKDPVATTDPGTTDTTDPDTSGATVDPSGGPDGTGADKAPTPAAPATLLGGAWIGSVGSIACLGDLKQRGETINGTITVGGQPFEVSGRYNEAKQSVYLRGDSNEAIIFRGSVDGGRVNGTARLGAGQIYQAWQLRKR